MLLMILLCVVVFLVCARGMEQSMKITKVDCISAITPFLFLTKADEVLELLKVLFLYIEVFVLNMIETHEDKKG